MGIIQKIMNKIRQGGAKIGMVESLNTILDHPKITINPEEYRRISDNLKYFRGKFPDIKYKNTYGKNQTRPYNSLNMAKVISRRLSSIIFNEQMSFSISRGKEQNELSEADRFAHETITNNGFLKNFENYLESALALGGLAMRPYFDGDKIDISYIQAPVFFPLQSNTNDVSEAAIVTLSSRTEGSTQTFYTLIEFHEWASNKYVIRNELYQSTDSHRVGYKVALNTLYDDLEESVFIENLSRPLFIYLKPFGMNNKDITSPLGISIFDNAKNTLKQINDTYDQFNWEVQMGQRRVSVIEDMLQIREDEAGELIQYFDSGQNVFISTGDFADGAKIGDLTTPIRSDDYIKAMNQFLKTLEMEVGLSTGTFSFDGQGLKTATEVVSENSMTYQTRNSHLSNVERAIKELLISILELGKVTINSEGKNLYNGEIPTLDDITLDFDDGVFIDKKSQLDYYAKALSAGMVSKEYAMKKSFNLNDEEVAQILAQIQSEQVPAANPMDAAIYGNRSK